MPNPYVSTDEVNGVKSTSTTRDFADAGKGTSDDEALAVSTTLSIPTDMSDSFLAARGTFYRVPLRTGAGPGLYAVEGLSQFIDNARKEKNEQTRRSEFDSLFPSPQPVSINMLDEDPRSYYAAVDFNEQITSENARRQDEDRAQANDKNSQAATPVLIMGIEISQTDIVSAVSCLNNIKVFYTFGQAFGNVVIRGEMLLGPLGSIQSDGVRILNDYFHSQRVSNLKKATTFSVAQTAYKMYMTGLMIGNVDVEFHVLPFVISGVLIDPSNQDSSLLNPANQVISTDQVTEVTTGTVNNGQAETAQTSQPVLSDADFDSSVETYRDLHESPTFVRKDLTPAQNAEIDAAYDAEQVAVKSKDYKAATAAIDNRNNTIQTAIAASPAGGQTDASSRVRYVLKGDAPLKEEAVPTVSSNKVAMTSYERLLAEQRASSIKQREVVVPNITEHSTPATSTTIITEHSTPRL